MTPIQDRINKILDRYLDADSAERSFAAKFRGWFGSEGHVREKYEALERSFSESVRFDPDPSERVFESYRKLSEKLGFPSEDHAVPTKRMRFDRRHILVRVAAVFIPVFMALGAALYADRLVGGRELGVHEIADVLESVGHGDQKHIVLPDGSHVWANGGTHIGYCDDFLDNRVVYIDGEAFFDVKNADNQPFTVRSGSLTATVRGTTFNIKAYRDSLTTEVVLATGKLDVVLDRKTYEMQPNMQIVMDNRSKSVVVNDISSDDIPCWMARLQFDNIPYSEVFCIISQYFGVSVECLTQFTGEERVTAVFDEDVTLDKVLFVLQNTALQFSYQITGNTVRISDY